MNTQTHIPNTGGSTGEKHLQNVSARVEQNCQEAPEQADQPINPQEANPNIQHHLAATPGNMGELEAERNEKQKKLVFPIFEYPKVDASDQLNAAELIQDGTQRNAAYLSIVQDPKVHSDYRLSAAKLIKDDTQRNAAYLFIAQDPEVYILHRLKAVGLIKEGTQRDAVYFSIAQDLTVDPADRLSAAKFIKENTQRDAVYLSIAQDLTGDLSYRLKAAHLIKDNTQRRVVDTVYLSIAQDPEIDPYDRLEAAKRIKDGTQRDTAYLSITKDPKVGPYYRLAATRRIKEDIHRDAVDAIFLGIAEDPEIDPYYRLEATELIVDHKTQAVLYPSMIETILSSDAFEGMKRLIAFVEGLPDAEIKNLAIKTICQNWPPVQDEHFQDNLALFCSLYELASDDVVRAELITAVVTRTEWDAAFRKAVVEEHVKNPTEQECLLKAIEEKQEESLNASRTKRAL